MIHIIAFAWVWGWLRKKIVFWLRNQRLKIFAVNDFFSQSRLNFAVNDEKKSIPFDCERRTHHLLWKILLKQKLCLEITGILQDFKSPKYGAAIVKKASQRFFGIYLMRYNSINKNQWIIIDCSWTWSRPDLTKSFIVG